MSALRLARHLWLFQHRSRSLVVSSTSVELSKTWVSWQSRWQSRWVLKSSHHGANGYCIFPSEHHRAIADASQGIDCTRSFGCIYTPLTLSWLSGANTTCLVFGFHVIRNRGPCHPRKHDYFRACECNYSIIHLAEFKRGP